MICMSCGKPADVEITPTFLALTARGERACELVEKAGITPQAAYVTCLMKTGEAIERGDFAEDEES